MRHLDNYKEFRLNEGIFGNFFKKLKDKFSLSLSKNFGNAKDADRIAEEYKKDSITAQQQKLQYIKALGEYIKTLKDPNVEKDESKIKELKSQIKAADGNFKKQLEIIKQKYDIKFQEVVDEEENKKITNYIKLKKLEIEQELLSKELQIVQEAGISDDDMKKDPDFEKMISAVKNRVGESQKEAEIQKAEIEKSKTEETIVGFDMDAAKAAAQAGDKKYLWEKGKFANGQHEFRKGERISYFSETNSKDSDDYQGTEAEVIATKLEDEDRIQVRTQKGAEIEINKGVVIKSLDEEKEEKSDENSAEKNPEDDSN